MWATTVGIDLQELGIERRGGRHTHDTRHIIDAGACLENENEHADDDEEDEEEDCT